MRKYFIFSLVLILVLSGCNLPLTKSTPTIDIIATTVAKTLDAAKNPTATIATSEVAETTVAPETTATNTAEPSATPTVTNTPLPEDPSVKLGDPAYMNNLDSPSAFFTGGQNSYEDSASKIRISGGVMELTSFNPVDWKGWRLTARKPGRFYLEGTFKTMSCSTSDNYGLVFRAPDYNTGQGYYVGMTCDGRYGFQVWDAGGVSSIQGWTDSNEILSGSNQTNRLGIWVDGSNFKIYINGKLVKELSDGTLTTAGFIGAWISATSSANFTVQMDKIGYWNLP
ncbi:MAG: DUF1080 domain-containing protein [Anaerolineaceae bacterium]|nr:DUF1080 domain-containing protein [Anaerolineaceae bacterium]